jgi:hypothetical protein
MDSPFRKSHKDPIAIPGNTLLTQRDARTQQTAQHRVAMAYAYGPLILATPDRRILDIPLEERIFNQEYLTDLVT